MKIKKVTDEGLAEKALISERTIGRLKNEPNYNKQLDTITAICIALQLPPLISEYLLSLAGFTLKDGEKQNTYRYLLNNTPYNHCIHDFNEYLEVIGFTPLSGKE